MSQRDKLDQECITLLEEIRESLGDFVVINTTSDLIEIQQEESTCPKSSYVENPAIYKRKKFYDRG